MYNKFENLKKYLNELNEQGICLAFSGGIDSTLLLYILREMNILTVTFNSNFQTNEEIDFTKKLCKKYGIRQALLNIDIFSNPVILNNPKDRCYHCKKMLFENAIKIAHDNGLKYILDGTNFDDLSCYRPGEKLLRNLELFHRLQNSKLQKKR